MKPDRSQSGQNNYSRQRKCRFCLSDHSTLGCRMYPTVQARAERIKELRICFSCLNDNHYSDQCRTKEPCRNCRGNHHTALCYRTENNLRTSINPVVNGVIAVQNSATNELTSHPNSSASNTYPASNPHPIPNTPDRTPLPPPVQPPTSHIGSLALRATVQSQSNVPTHAHRTISTCTPTGTLFIAGGGKRGRVRAHFDTGAQRSFIKAKVAKDLALPELSKCRIAITPFGGEAREMELPLVKVVGKLGNHRVSMKVLAYEKAGTKEFVPGLCMVANYLREQEVTLADREIDSDVLDDIDLVIGQDYYHQYITGSSNIKGISVMLSPAGVLINGVMPTWSYQEGLDRKIMTQGVVCQPIAITDIEQIDLERMWDLETIGIIPQKFSPEELDTIEQVANSIEYVDGQYQVALPFKGTARPPTNFRIAIGQLTSLSRKFESDPDLYGHYTNIFNEYVESGFTERVPNDPIAGHYLPHHPVYKQSLTTPIRVVFNASSKADSSLSLNDCLNTGPSLTQKLFDVLIKFRLNEHACIADISKAFLRISISPESRSYCKFLFCDPSNPHQHTTYQFKVVPFGATCSPFLLQKVLDHHFTKSANPIVKDLTTRFYVDNYCNTFNNMHEMCQHKHIVDATLQEAGMPLQGWVSNNHEFNQQFQEDHGDPIQSVLGIAWDTHDDTIHVVSKDWMKERMNEENYTKRRFVSLLSSVFDPLGLISPIIIKGKLILRNLWQLKLSWDQRLPLDIVTDCNSLLTELGLATQITFPSFVITTEGTELHMFCDASAAAYGAAAFTVSSGGSHLLMSKARVAPQRKKLTIPRLELVALNLGVKLAHTLCQDISFSSCTLWTDAEVVLHWVRGNSPDVFVSNRVKEIREFKFPIKYVPTDQNPADILTRGTTVKKLTNSPLWNHGPEWLLSKNYPVQKEQFAPDSIMVHELVAEAEHVVPPPPVIELERFSKLSRWVGIIKKLYIFMKRCGFRTHLDPVVALVYHEQRQHYPTLYAYLTTESTTQTPEARRRRTPKEIKLFADQLGLRIGTGGLIESRGRIDNAHLPTCTQTPMLLPPRSLLTAMIIRDLHEKHHHCGVSTLVVLIRRHYWLPRARTHIKKLVRSCVHCRKVRGEAMRRPPPPPLPRERVVYTRPFACAGVDYMGPITVKIPYENEHERAYVCLFTCTVSRAVHLEVTKDLTTEGFLMGFRRFCSVQGVPNTIISDNARNFIGGHRFLEDLADDPDVTSHMEVQRIEWKWITPRSPWEGGFYERMIQVVKSCLHKVLYRRQISFEELRTLTREFQTIINNRPLTYIPEEQDTVILTPNRLLHGRDISLAPQLDTMANADSSYGGANELRGWYRRLSAAIMHFEKCWTNDYLTALRARHYGNNRTAPSTPFKVGDIVLANLDDSHRTMWPLAKVIEIMPSCDGTTRSVAVLANGRRYVRSITKLVPIELPADNEATDMNLSPPSRNDEEESESEAVHPSSSTSAPPDTPPTRDDALQVEPRDGHPPDVRPRRAAAQKCETQRRALIQKDQL